MARKGGTADVIVVGAGIFGLSVALACAWRGLRATVLERESPGAGASGGLVGALAPFAPDPWTAKKAFQFRALATAGTYWRRVAEEGGRDPRFSRPGRLVPLADAAARDRAIARQAASMKHWGSEYAWRVLTPADVPAFLAPGAAECGAVLDTLSARITPRPAIAALLAAVTARGGKIRSHTSVLGVSDGVVVAEGTRLCAGAIVLATGQSSISPAPPMAGVKGQAALLAVPESHDWPLVQMDGLYLVPHGDGTVAVGSTIERSWADPRSTDANLDTVIARARALCPLLASADILDRWAGLRPRAPRPDPLLGLLPGYQRTWIATGGYGIGFGIAHSVADAVAEMITGGAADVPALFLPEGHGLTPAP